MDPVLLIGRQVISRWSVLRDLTWLEEQVEYLDRDECCVLLLPHVLRSWEYEIAAAQDS